MFGEKGTTRLHTKIVDTSINNNISDLYLLFSQKAGATQASNGYNYLVLFEQLK